MNRGLNHPYNHSNDLRKKIEDYSYGLKDIIGKGYSSVVYRGINEKTKETVAIKVIDIKSIQGKPEKKMLEGEIDALKKLAHSNILKCHDIYSTANNCYIITEFCNEGDLEALLKKRGKLPENEAIPIIRDFLDGFRHLGESGFLHRDLKPANILMKDKMAKIADFGFAKRASSSSNKESINVGSPLYMSPQALNSNIYSIKNDIWSIGIILYEILHGKVPWSCTTEDQLKVQIQKNNVSLLKNLSEDLKDFIRRCLTVDMTKRISLSEISKHAFIERICEDMSIPQFVRKPTTQFQSEQQQNDENISERNARDNLKKEYVSNNNQRHNYHQEKERNPHIDPHSHKSHTPTDVQLAQINTKNPQQIHHNKNHTFNGFNTEKQLHCQINWMRFLYKLNELFPRANQSGRSTLNLRFIITKQMLSQLNVLKKCLNGDNVLRIDGLQDFLKGKVQSGQQNSENDGNTANQGNPTDGSTPYGNSEVSNRYMKILEDYTHKYSKNSKDFDEWLPIVEKDRKMSKYTDHQFNRSEGLSLLGINAALQECKNIWKSVKESHHQINEKDLSAQLLRLDFIISYYQLNCLLIDNFENCEYFTRHSKLEHITEYKPMPLGVECLKELENKLILLEIVK